MVLQLEQTELRTLITARFERSMEVSETFFTLEAERIAEACWAMARRFHQGGRLLSFGNGVVASDAQHIAVEFVHPVLVGKRALPALALMGATSSGNRNADGSPDTSFASQLKVLGRSQDIAVGFSPDGHCPNVLEALQAARHKGMLTLALTGGDGGELAQADLDFCFVVRTNDSMIMQESHRTLYHILWELVHVFFEHEGLLT